MSQLIVISIFHLIILSNALEHGQRCESIYRYDGCCSNFFKDKMNGTCKPCLIGYYGQNCSQKCKHPRYGAKCKSICHCGKDKCDISKGCLGNMTESIFAATISKSLGVTKENGVETMEDGFKNILENPIMYGIISVGMLAAVLLSVYCIIRLRECILHVSSPI